MTNTHSHGDGSASCMISEEPRRSSLRPSGTSPGPTLDADALVEAWLAPVAPGTARQYRQALRDLAAWMGSDVPGCVRSMLATGSQAGPVSLLLEKWAADRGELTIGTRRQRVGAVCSLLRYAAAMGVGGPGAVRVRIQGEVREPVTRASSMVRVREVLVELDDASRSGPGSMVAARDVAIISVLASTGIRRAECAGILLEHLDLERGTLRVLRKGRRWELLELPPGCIRRLSRWVALLPWEDGPLWGRVARCGGFVQSPGLHPDSLARVPQRYGLGTPHDLRRMAGRWAVKSGGEGGSPADMESLRSFLGHRSLAATTAYTRAQGDGGASVRRALARALSSEEE